MSKAELRNLWFKIHKWIGLFLLALIIPISISGAALVWKDTLDALVNPERYMIGDSVRRALSELARFAVASAQHDERVSSLRIGHRGVVVAEVVTPTIQGSPTRMFIWIDPTTGRVLGRAGTEEGLIRMLHMLHGSLLLPTVGRQVVGVVGSGMLILSFTGAWLWWPLTGRAWRGVRWRRRKTVNANLHLQAGFWVALPLAMLSFTGIWITFPKAFAKLSGAPYSDTRALVQQMPAVPLRTTSTMPERAAAAALKGQSEKIVAIKWPTDLSPEWQIDVLSDAGVLTAVSTSDATGILIPSFANEPQPIARPMRTLHDGTGRGPLWQMMVFIGGILPLLLAITGLIMWIREQHLRKA